MRIFDTQVQELKYKVLMELAWQTWKGNDALMVFNEIANEIVKKGEPPMSCCIYKDRAIVAERIRLALGGVAEIDSEKCLACIDGCIGGAACLKHGDSNKAGIDSFGREAGKTEILQAAEPYLGGLIYELQSQA